MEATPRTCACGCKAEVNRRYLPGHDAKHKSALTRGLRSADWRLAHACAEALAELGWTHHAKPADLEAVPYRTSTGAVVQPVADVEIFQVSADGQHHASRSCPSLTAYARRVGMLNARTGRADERSLTFVANAPELTERLRRSWDQCTTCTTDHGRVAHGQAYRMYSLVTDLAADAA